MTRGQPTGPGGCRGCAGDQPPTPRLSGLILERWVLDRETANLDHQQPELDNGVFQRGAQLDQAGWNFIRTTEPRELFAHFGLDQRCAEELHHTIVDAARQRMWSVGHTHATLTTGRPSARCRG